MATTKQFSSKTELVDEETDKTFRIDFKGSNGKTGLIILAVICVIAVSCLCTGIALIAKTGKCESVTGSTKGQSKTGSTGTSMKQQCSYSAEAKRIGLDEFLKKVKEIYYKNHPENTVWHPDSTTDKIRKEYRAYDPTPAKIKERTDAAISLLNEINSKVIITRLLTSLESFFVIMLSAISYLLSPVCLFSST